MTATTAEPKRALEPTRRLEAADLRAFSADRDDKQARERLIRAYLPLARSIARRFGHGDRVPLDDLQQVAAVGLIKALDRYDPDNGAAFTSYAVPTMQGEIRRYLRDFSWMVRPPRELQERAVRVERERELLTGELGRSPTATELAERVGCTVEELLDATQAAQAQTSDSLQRPVHTDEEGADVLGARLGTEDPAFAHAEASATVDHLLDALPPHDRLVVILRFREELTQAEIARRIGRTQTHVSRVLRAALLALADSAALAPGDARHHCGRELVLD